MAYIILLMVPQPDGVTLPSRELAALADSIASTPNISNKWRFLSIQEKNKGAVKFALATLNKTENKNYIFEMSPTVWAIDTVALGWPPEYWESFIKTESYYTNAGIEVLASFFKDKLGTSTPLIRDDHFLSECWEPDRYVLAIGMPQTRQEFQNRFINHNSVNSALFGVVTEKLSVSKLPSKFGRFSGPEGSVWMRVLYANVSDIQEARLTALDLNDGDHYEFIWQLPNGLDGYVTYGKNGRLALTVPTTISHDKAGEAVKLGVSCINCHVNGPRHLDHADTINKLVLFGATNPKQWDSERLSFQARQDSQRMIEATINLTGVSPSEVHKAIFDCINAYKGDLDSKAIIRELGLTEWAGPATVTRSQFATIVANASSSRVNRLYMEAVRKRVSGER